VDLNRNDVGDRALVLSFANDEQQRLFADNAAKLSIHLCDSKQKIAGLKPENCRWKAAKSTQRPTSTTELSPNFGHKIAWSSWLLC
jgi:hypothetical protein